MNGASLDRFRKIVGMLGSDQPGERAAAALKATGMLREAGMTWAQVGLGNGASAYVPNETNLSQYWESMYKGERATVLRQRDDIKRLKREVDRLSGMWRNGEPQKPAPIKITPEAAEAMPSFDNKPLRKKVAAAVEACAAGRLHVSGEHLQMFRFLMRKSRWSPDEKAMIKKALVVIYANAGG